MRSKKAQDFWRSVRKNESPLKINRIYFEKLGGVGTGDLSFSSTINGICGKNGLGKSTLLKSIYVTLAPEEMARFPELAGRLDGAYFSIELTDGDDSHTIEFGDAEAKFDVIYLDPSELCHVSLEVLRQEKNISELLEQYEFAPFDDTSLKEIKRILGRDYKTIEFLELEGIGDYRTLPFFRVCVHGVTYDTRDMALGELSVLYIWWRLWKSINSPHLVLLEEPENFLTPQAQRYLTDYLAFVALKSHLWILLSTHSEHVIENVGLEATSVVVENPVDGSVIVKNPRHDMEVLEHLGLDPRKKGLILVEDGASKIVFEQACSYFGSFILHDFEVISNNGSGPIKKLLENFPSSSQSVECVGVFDGDERNKIRKGSLKNAFFLPGDLSPEKTFQTLIREDPKICSDALKVDYNRLIEKLSVVVGQDEHDWFDNLRQALALDYPTTVRDLSLLWLQRDSEAFRQLISSLDSSVPEVPENPEANVVSQSEDRPRLRVNGRVDTIVVDKGFGFLMSDDGESLFFHRSSLENVEFKELSRNVVVSFEVQSTEKRLRKAVCIRLVESS